MTTTDYAQLKAARELLTRIPLPLDVEADETPGTPYTVTHDGTAEHGTATARTLLAAMARQLDDYILPRSASVDNPLTIVVGGSTGAVNPPSSTPCSANRSPSPARFDPPPATPYSCTAQKTKRRYHPNASCPPCRAPAPPA